MTTALDLKRSPMKACEVIARHLSDWKDGTYGTVAADKADSILSALDKAGIRLLDCSNWHGGGAPEIRPNEGAHLTNRRCEDTDEVIGAGVLHVEQMDKDCFWARLDTGVEGKDIVMWFHAKKGRITLTAEFE